MALKPNEVIINHRGVLYKGTVSDYIRLSTTLHGMAKSHLPIATQEEIEEHATRCGWKKHKVAQSYQS